MNGATTASRQTELGGLLDRLRRASESLEKTVAIADDRLTCVLRAASPQPLAPGPTEVQVETQHGLALRDIAGIIERAEQRLSSVIGRLEV